VSGVIDVWAAPVLPRVESMMIRRTAAALVAAVALAAGGTTACSAATDSNTGTPKDTASNTSGNNPGGASQGNLPDNSNLETSSGAGRAGGNGKGVP
jgi:hypothetical protein